MTSLSLLDIQGACSSVAELCSLHVTCFPRVHLKEPRTKNRSRDRSRKKERGRRAELALTPNHSTFPKLTKEFACKQHGADLGMKTHQVVNSLRVKIVFSNPTLALHIREGGKPVFPPAQDHNRVFHCDQPPSSQPRIQLESKREKKIRTNSIVSHSADCNQGCHPSCRLTV